MAGEVTWQDRLRDLAGFIKRVAREHDACAFDPKTQDNVEWLYYSVLFSDRDELLERARLARGAMRRAALVPPLPGGPDTPDARHRAYELVEGLIREMKKRFIYGKAGKRTPIWSNSLPEAPAEYEAAFREAIAAASTSGVSTPPAADAAPTKARAKRRKWLAEAMLLVRDHAGWSDRQIAASVGVHPSQLTAKRCPEYAAAAAMAREKRDEQPRGYRERGDDGERTGRVERAAPQTGDRIPGSRCYRGQCPGCGAETRVESLELAETMLCEKCR